MAVNLDDVGVQTYTASTLCDRVEYEQKLTEVEAPACDGGFGAAEVFDPVIEFSMSGKGDLPALLVVGTDGGTDGVITGVNDGPGTRVFTSIKEMEKNDDFNSWEAEGFYYPSAIVTP